MLVYTQIYVCICDMCIRVTVLFVCIYVYRCIMCASVRVYVYIYIHTYTQTGLMLDVYDALRMASHPNFQSHE